MSFEASELACTRGGRQLFSKISFHVEAGDAMRVLGANGSGKTSLLRILCGLSQPVKGQVSWQGECIGAAREGFNSALTYIGHTNGVKDDLTALENLSLASTLAGTLVSRAQVCQALKNVGLEEVTHLPVRMLSQGQKRRVGLARLHTAATPLWILDEPFVALDETTVSSLCQTLNRHLDSGGMVIYTTHQDIALRAQRALILDLSPPC